MIEFDAANPINVDHLLDAWSAIAAFFLHNVAFGQNLGHFVCLALPRLRQNPSHKIDVKLAQFCGKLEKFQDLSLLNFMSWLGGYV